MASEVARLGSDIMNTSTGSITGLDASLNSSAGSLPGSSPKWDNPFRRLRRKRTTGPQSQDADEVLSGGNAFTASPVTASPSRGMTSTSLQNSLPTTKDYNLGTPISDSKKDKVFSGVQSSPSSASPHTMSSPSRQTDTEASPSLNTSTSSISGKRIGRFSAEVKRQESARRESRMISKYEAQIAELKNEIARTRSQLLGEAKRGKQASSTSTQLESEVKVAHSTLGKVLRALSEGLDSKDLQEKVDTDVFDDTASSLTTRSALVARVLDSQTWVASSGGRRGELARMKAQLAESEQRRKDLDALALDRTARLQREMKDWSDMVTTLQRDLKNSREDRSSLENSLQQSLEENERLQRQIETNQSHGSQHDHEVQRLQLQLQEMRDLQLVDVPSLQQEYATVTRERDAALRRTRAMQAEVDDALKRTERAEAEFAELAKTAAGLQTDRKALQDQLNAIHAEGVLMQQRTLLQKDGIARLGGTLNDKEVQRRQLESDVVRLQQECDVTKIERDQAKSQLQGLQSSNNHLTEQVQALHRAQAARVSEMNSEMTRLQKEVTALTKELKGARDSTRTRRSSLSTGRSGSPGRLERRVSFGGSSPTLSGVPNSPGTMSPVPSPLSLDASTGPGKGTPGKKKVETCDAETATDITLSNDGPNRLLWSQSWTDIDSEALVKQDEKERDAEQMQQRVIDLERNMQSLMLENRRLTEKLQDNQRERVTRAMMNGAYVNPMDPLLTGLNRLSIGNGSSN